MASDRTRVTLYYYRNDRPVTEPLTVRSVDESAADALVQGARDIAIKQEGWLQPKPFTPSHFEVAKQVERWMRRPGGRMHIDVDAIKRFYLTVKQPIPAQVQDAIDAAEEV